MSGSVLPPVAFTAGEVQALSAALASAVVDGRGGDPDLIAAVRKLAATVVCADESREVATSDARTVGHSPRPEAARPPVEVSARAEASDDRVDTAGELSVAGVRPVIAGPAENREPASHVTAAPFGRLRVVTGDRGADPGPTASDHAPSEAGARAAGRRGSTVVVPLRPVTRADRRVEVDEAVRATVEQTVRERRVLRLQYVDGRGVVTERDVEPAGLLAAGGRWTLVGWCRARGEGRGFRLDRILAAERTEIPAPDRDLASVLGPLGRVDRSN